jgi:hypothetical protein
MAAPVTVLLAVEGVDGAGAGAVVVAGAGAEVAPGSSPVAVGVGGGLDAGGTALPGVVVPSATGRPGLVGAVLKLSSTTSPATVATKVAMTRLILFLPPLGLF